MAPEIDKLLLKFFDAEISRDWDAFRKYLSADVEWTIFGPPRRRVIKGRTEYLEAMKKFYSTNKSKFYIISIAVNRDRGIVTAELEMDSRRSVDIFEFKDGLIYKEREYYDDCHWLAESQNESAGGKTPRREFAGKTRLQGEARQSNKV